jgi:acyl carrier protein
MKDKIPEAIVAAIRSVLRDSGRDAGRGVESSMLLAADLGLDSLDLAQTIVLLERSLGIDPFRTPSVQQPVVRTVGDLIVIYTKAASAS